MARRLTLAELARRAGTSAPTLHRYESGWDRFQVATLRRISRALGARLEIRMVPRRKSRPRRPLDEDGLAEILAPLFWDKPLAREDLERYPLWVLGRALTFGGRDQVAAARHFYGDEMIRRAIAQRTVDPRTRNYWQLMLGDG